MNTKNHKIENSQKRNQNEENLSTNLENYPNLFEKFQEFKEEAQEFLLNLRKINNDCSIFGYLYFSSNRKPILMQEI